MGRYKSVLMAARDAKAFPHHVEVPVPDHGMGRRMDVIAQWLNRRVGTQWRSHGQWNGGEQISRYMFCEAGNAEMFRAALESGELGRDTDR